MKIKPRKKRAERVPFYYETIEDLLNHWPAFTAMMERSSLKKSLRTNGKNIFEVVSKARQIWPVIPSYGNRHVLDQQDIVHNSFLSSLVSLGTRGILEPAGFMLTLHTFASEPRFKPTAFEVLACLDRASAEINKSVASPIVAYDLLGPAPLLAEMTQSSDWKEGTPFFTIINAGRQPVHASVAELFVGEWPEDILMQPIRCMNHTYNANHTVGSYHAPFEL